MPEREGFEGPFGLISSEEGGILGFFGGRTRDPREDQVTELATHARDAVKESLALMSEARNKLDQAGVQLTEVTEVAIRLREYDGPRVEEELRDAENQITDLIRALNTVDDDVADAIRDGIDIDSQLVRAAVEVRDQLREG